MREFLKRMSTAARVANGASLRGRIFRCGIVKGGEISVTVRFGLEELEAARQLVPGMLLEVVEVPEAEKPEKKGREKT